MIETAALTAGLHALLSADATLATLIADYGDDPAVFHGSSAPDNLVYTQNGTGSWPVVLIAPVTGALRLATGDDYWRVERMVQLHAPRTGDSLVIERAADRVAEILDTIPTGLVVPGYDVGVVDATVPVEIEGPDKDTVARGVFLTVEISKEL